MKSPATLPPNMAHNICEMVTHQWFRVNASPDCEYTLNPLLDTAQQRPEVELRLHAQARLYPAHADHAQRRPEVELRLHVQVENFIGGDYPRSTKAGGGTPATRAASAVWPQSVEAAQRRPEVELRLHVLVDVDQVVALRRSTKAGGGTPATRDPRKDRRKSRVRSTKAGGGTPATRASKDCRPHR